MEKDELIWNPLSFAGTSILFVLIVIMIWLIMLTHETILKESKMNMKISNEIGHELFCGNDVDNFKFIQKDSGEQGRWTVSYEVIFMHIKDGTYWALYYDAPATESQPHPDWDFECYQVKPVEVKVVKYERVD